MQKIETVHNQTMQPFLPNVKFTIKYRKSHFTNEGNASFME